MDMNRGAQCRPKHLIDIEFTSDGELDVHLRVPVAHAVNAMKLVTNCVEGLLQRGEQDAEGAPVLRQRGTVERDAVPAPGTF